MAVKWVGRIMFAVGIIMFVGTILVLIYANLTGMEMG